MPERLLEHFALWPRSAWDKTPRSFTDKDWYSWRFRRRLSLVARPFIRLGKGNHALVIFAPGMVRDSIGLLLDRLLNGRLPAEEFRSPQMRSWIGEVTRQRGDEFEDLVARELRSVGLEALVRRRMTEFGADDSYGDLDVLAWRPQSGLFYIIESKRLRFARTVAEIGEQLREFQGEEMDRLTRHLRRCDWLAQHPDALRRVARTNLANSKLMPLLVTSTVVPMQFTKGLPLPPERIVPLSRLRSWVNGHRG